MKRILWILCIPAVIFALSCNRSKEEMPHTERTATLLSDLLTRLDSMDVYSARLDGRIDELKARLPMQPVREHIALRCAIADVYSSYNVDSAIVYVTEAEYVAKAAGLDSLRINAGLLLSEALTSGGFFMESQEVLAKVPRKSLKPSQIVPYYHAWSSLYHGLCTSLEEPKQFVEEYRCRYDTYVDSLLIAADPADIRFLHNIERREARAGNYDGARRYNAARMGMLTDTLSADYATALYDRFMISYYYKKELTGEAVDDLLQSAIIEVRNSKYDIASLLRLEAILSDYNHVRAAKKVSDAYYASVQRYGSRKRLLEGGEWAIKINERDSRLLRSKNHELILTLFLISLLAVALLLAIMRVGRDRDKLERLYENLQRSGRITKSYIGVVFGLYSSYMKRLDTFRTRIHATLRRGHVDHALELTSPAGDMASEERRELFKNFDSAFVDIFPDFIDTVNSCLKPEERIVPKKTEILNNELRILALVKLGMEDSAEIADMLQCSVKTVYNLRSILKARLAIPEEEFNDIISKL